MNDIGTSQRLCEKTGTSFDIFLNISISIVYQEIDFGRNINYECRAEMGSYLRLSGTYYMYIEYY